MCRPKWVCCLAPSVSAKAFGDVVAIAALIGIWLDPDSWSRLSIGKSLGARQNATIDAHSPKYRQIASDNGNKVKERPCT